MAIDLYKSRRGKFRKCAYWLNVKSPNLSKWVLENAPDGIFYAEEANAYNIQNTQIANAFLANKGSVTLVTNDDVKNLTQGSVVEYLGHAWFVDAIQTQITKKRTEFSEEEIGITYINIRR